MGVKRMQWSEVIIKVFLVLTILSPSILGYSIVQSWGKQTIEDGPYGGNGGSLWTDGGEVHLNGLISEIELRTGSEVDSIRAKYGDVWVRLTVEEGAVFTPSSSTLGPRYSSCMAAV